MVMNRTFIPSLLITLAFASASPAQHPATENATELEPVTVTAPPTPSWERDARQLRLRIDKSTPCFGCDTVARPQARPVYLTLQDYLLRPVGQVDEGTTLARHVKLQDSPDLQYLRR